MFLGETLPPYLRMKVGRASLPLKSKLVQRYIGCANAGDQYERASLRAFFSTAAVF